MLEGERESTFMIRAACSVRNIVRLRRCFSERRCRPWPDYYSCASGRTLTSQDLPARFSLTQSLISLLHGSNPIISSGIRRIDCPTVRRQMRLRAVSPILRSPRPGCEGLIDSNGLPEGTPAGGGCGSQRRTESEIARNISDRDCIDCVLCILGSAMAGKRARDPRHCNDTGDRSRRLHLPRVRWRPRER